MKKFRFAIVLLWIAATSFAQSSRQTALVVIDMQEPFITRGGDHEKTANVEKVKKILDVQLKAIESAKKAGIPIVFLEYAGNGPTNDKLVNAAKSSKDVKTFIKDTDGMFESSNSHLKELEDYLKSKNINQLIITGANGGACVKSSIEGALDKEYHVIALDTGIADFNYPDFIYPYDTYYQTSLDYQCQQCTFRETNDLKDAFESFSEKDVLKKANEAMGAVKKLNSPVKDPGCEPGAHYE